jgi:hypothetical protein
MKTDHDYDEERRRLIAALIAEANDALGRSVDECAKRLPLVDLAAIIWGSAKGVGHLVVGERGMVAERMRSSCPAEVAYLATKLGERGERGFLRCGFVVKLAGGSVDVSVQALRMGGVS